MGDSMDDRTATDLAALADGSLTPDRREALPARPELPAQRAALAAILATENVRAPERLRAAVAALEAEQGGAVGFAADDAPASRRAAGRRDARGRGPAAGARGRRRWRVPTFSLAAVAAVVAATLVLVL